MQLLSNFRTEYYIILALFRAKKWLFSQLVPGQLWFDELGLARHSRSLLSGIYPLKTWIPDKLVPSLTG